jgi:hypothetical protein
MMPAGGRSFRLMKGASVVLSSRPQMGNIIFRDGMSFIGLCLSITGFCALGYQFLLWLKYGSWSPLAFRLVLELIGVREPASSSRGIEKIGAWMLDLPLSGIFIISGLAITVFGVGMTAGACAPEAADREPMESTASTFDNRQQ